MESDSPESVLLHLEHVQKTFQRGPQVVRALDDVSLRLAPGDYLAIRGPSGCGKSTLLLTSGGLLRPDAGAVRLMGEDLYDVTPNRRAELRAMGVGFVFQQFHLVPYLTVLDNVLAATLGLPKSGSSARAGHVSRGKDLAGSSGHSEPLSPSQSSVASDSSSSDAIHERAMTLLERFGLVDRRLHVPAKLSVGERQRTALARALLNRPRVLLADEPTGNLDDANAEIVWRVLADFASEGGAVLLVTHDQRAAGIARQTFEMSAGQLLTSVSPRESA